MGIDVYSQTPASNYLSGYFQTGMAPSQVKVAGSDIMADMAQQLLGLPTSTGSANTQAVANTRTITSYVAGYGQWFIPGYANTGAATLNIDGIGATAIHLNAAVLLGGELSTFAPAFVKYDGTVFNLINPYSVAGSFTLTLTGMTGSVTGTVNYRIQGRIVNVYIASVINGTSNATTMTGTGVPALIQPGTGKYIYPILEDASSYVQGLLATGASGTWTFGKAVDGTGGFTASGSKGISRNMFSYTLD